MFQSINPTEISNSTHPPPPPPPQQPAPVDVDTTSSTHGCPSLPSPISLNLSAPHSSQNVPNINNTPRTETVIEDSCRSGSDDPNEIIRQRIILKEQRLNEIKNQCSALISELDNNNDPEAIVKRHISQLKKYHELKDIALGLVTMIADQRHLRTTDILEEMKFELLDD